MVSLLLVCREYSLQALLFATVHPTRPHPNPQLTRPKNSDTYITCDRFSTLNVLNLPYSLMKVYPLPCLAPSGLEIDPVNGGVVVNGQLEAVSGIYAAGACASYYDQVTESVVYSYVSMSRCIGGRMPFLLPGVTFVEVQTGVRQ